MYGPGRAMEKDGTLKPCYTKTGKLVFLRQVSVDMKMKNLKIKTSFVSPDGLQARFNQRYINFIFTIFKENCLHFYAIHTYTWFFSMAENRF